MSGLITGYDPKTQNFIDTDLFDVSKHVTQTSGVLEVGVSYTIITFVAGDNFTNVGGTNVTGNVFVATGTTPTTYTNGSTLAKYVTQSYTYAELKAGLDTYSLEGTLTADQINTLDTTPVEFMPAQGANKIVVITGLTAVRKAGTAYTTVNDITIRYNTTTTVISAVMTNTGLIGTANYVSANYYLSSDYVAANINSSIEFYCGSAISGGTGDLYYKISYKIVDFN